MKIKRISNSKWHWWPYCCAWKIDNKRNRLKKDNFLWCGLLVMLERI